jgi:hypothetical protein
MRNKKKAKREAAGLAAVAREVGRLRFTDYALRFRDLFGKAGQIVYQFTWQNEPCHIVIKNKEN